MRNWVHGIKNMSTDKLLSLVLEDNSWMVFCKLDDELANRAIAGDAKAYNWYVPKEDIV